MASSKVRRFRKSLCPPAIVFFAALYAYNATAFIPTASKTHALRKNTFFRIDHQGENEMKAGLIVQGAVLPLDDISTAKPSHRDGFLKDADDPKEERSQVEQRRQELKQQLVKSAAEFSTVQKQLERAAKQKLLDAQQAKESGPYFLRLLLKILKKVVGKKNKMDKNDKRGGILSTKAFGTQKLEVGKAGNEVISIAEELSKLSPTPVPTFGWKGYKSGNPADCKLGGKWKLIFTTAADASFSESPKRGEITTSQEVDPDIGTLTNVIDFERGKIKGFRVVVAGEAVADDEIELLFRRVEILRESRFPRLFGRIVFPIPAKYFVS